MADLPPRYCEICQMIHQPPIHDLATCRLGRSGRIYFTKAFDPNYWPTKDEMHAQVRYWDAVFADKGLKPLS